MEEHKNTSYASPKSGEEVERELEAYINEPKNGKRRRISLSGAVRAIRGQSPKKTAVGNDYLDAALSTNSFLGYEAISEPE